jgi:hypothetical protein
MPPISTTSPSVTWSSAAPTTTIGHNRYCFDNGDKIACASGFKDRFQSFIQRSLETTPRAHQAGVKIALGPTSSKIFGENTRELAWFVKAWDPAWIIGAV